MTKKALFTNRAKSGCVAIIMIFAMVITLCYWLLYSRELDILLLNKNNPESVIHVFFIALIKHRIEVIDSLVDPVQKPRIEAWLNGREVVSCSWDFSFEREANAVGAFDNDGKTYVETRYFSSPCLENDYYYCLDIESIQVELTDTGWQITDWGEIYEARGNQFRCE